jgi:hypothetical protein
MQSLTSAASASFFQPLKKSACMVEAPGAPVARDTSVRIGGVPAGLTPQESRGVYGEVSGLGGRSGDGEGQQGGHEGAEHVREFITDAG